MTAVAGKVTGRCLCGACRYELGTPLAPGGMCFCEDCRRVTGSAFGVSFRAQKSELQRTGVTSTFARPADSGTVLTRHFCPQCGSPLYTESDAHAEAVFIKAGTLDEPSGLQIDRLMWTQSKVAWSEASPTAQSFEQGRT